MTSPPALLLTGTLPGDHRLVDRGGALHDLAVDRDLLPGPDPQLVADADVVDADLDLLPVPQQACGGGGELDQGADGVAGAGAGAGLDEPAEEDDGDDERDDLVVDLAHVLGEDVGHDRGDQAVAEGSDGAEGDEAVHLGAAVAQGPPAGGVDRPADPEEHRQRQQELGPGVLEQVRHVLLADEVLDHRRVQHREGEQRPDADPAGEVSDLLLVSLGLGVLGGGRAGLRAEPGSAPGRRNSARSHRATSSTWGPTPTARAVFRLCWVTPRAASATSAPPCSGEASGVSARSAFSRSPSPPSGGSATSVPCSMFIPHAQAYSPGSSMARSIVVVPKAASEALLRRSGNTTRAVQSLFSWRWNRSRTGVPASTRTRFGA
jgi:hypothetical protein